MRGKRTSLRLGGKPSGKARLLERSPFEILLIASTRNVPLATLLASRFRLVTLEALCLARNASYELSVVHVYLAVKFPLFFIYIFFANFSLFLSFSPSGFATSSPYGISSGSQKSGLSYHYDSWIVSVLQTRLS